jgi:hypothetical protein
MAKIGDGQKPRGVTTYDKRKVAGRGRLDQLKAKSKERPLGGGPPIPEGKLDPLTMPRPDFGPSDEPDPLPPPGAPQMPQEPIQGVGSAYPVNQAMAAGQTDGPVSLAQADRQGLGGRPMGQVSAETAELASKAELVQGQAPEKPGDPVQVPETSQETQDQLDQAERDIAESNQQIFPLDLDGLASLRGTLARDDRKKAIEGRLSKLNIDEVILHREIQQEVIIIPGRLIYTLRTFSEAEYQWCLQKVYQYPGSDAYVEELLNSFKISCALVALNGRPLPEHRINLGQPDEVVDDDKFNKKHHIVTSYPTQLMADLGIQYNWFNDRVTKLFTEEALGNG